MHSNESRQRVWRCFQRFINTARGEHVSLTGQTHLSQGLGMSSDEGIDFVLDLCEEFSFEFPNDFNPIIHSSGKRGLRMNEMVDRVLAHVPEEELAR